MPRGRSEGTIIRLIDCDIITYRAACAAEKKQYVVFDRGSPVQSFSKHVDAIEYMRENELSEDSYVLHQKNVEPEEHAIYNADSMMRTLAIGEYEGYLTGKNNFREKVSTIKKYKGNRTAPRPEHYQAVRDRLINRWGAVVVDGQEADDELGIRSTELAKEGHVPVIVSIDKDLDMIPGLHYNWVRDTTYRVDPEQAMYNFYKQCLMGDNTDNILGLPGIGPVKAEKLLEKSKDYRATVEAAWKQHFPKGVTKEDGSTISATEALEEVAKLLWIRRKRVD